MIYFGETRINNTYWLKNKGKYVNCKRKIKKCTITVVFSCSDMKDIFWINCDKKYLRTKKQRKICQLQKKYQEMYDS